MNNLSRIIFASTLLILTIGIAFGLPKHKYAGTDIIASLNLPQSLPGWHTEDLSDEINTNKESMYFIGHILEKEYDKDLGPLIYLFILDANNFHHPKVCIGGAGYDAQDLDDVEFKLSNHAWKAKAIYFQKGEEGFLTVYWICINKKEVDWTEQKLIQFWYSLFNKQKTGVMIRIDITTTRDQVPQAIQSIQDLLNDLSTQIPPEQQDYLFGK